MITLVASELSTPYATKHRMEPAHNNKLKKPSTTNQINQSINPIIANSNSSDGVYANR
jgi:hypothetical protein